MAIEEGTNVRRKKFNKIYYLLLVPAIAVGFLVTNLVTSANQTAVEIVSFPGFTIDSQAVLEEGSEATAEHYIPLATTEVNVGEELEQDALPATVKAILLKEVKGEGEETELATEDADILVEWDSSALDTQTPGEYMLSMKLPDGHEYKGVMPYILVTVKQAEGETADTAKQPEEEAGDDGLAEQPASIPCSHNEGCSVVCEDEQACQHTCDLECGGVKDPEIESFSGIYPGTVVVRYELQKGEEFVAQSSIFAFMKDGNIVQVPIEWTGKVDTNKAGAYPISMQIGGGYVWNGASLDGEIVVVDPENGR